MKESDLRWYISMNKGKGYVSDIVSRSIEDLAYIPLLQSRAMLAETL